VVNIAATSVGYDLKWDYTTDKDRRADRLVAWDRFR
jgi:hypothetical protein